MRARRALPWLPALVLLCGAAAAIGGAQQQRTLPLRAPLERVVPRDLYGYEGRDLVISEEERRVAGMTTYLARAYEAGAATAPFSIYVGYYDQQMRGKTIHSPRNCLPGAGWEPLTSRLAAVETAQGEVPVNHYVLQKGTERVIVLYWYQGRGRVAASEYLVKWDLLRDQALRGRSDEALVRVMVPVVGAEDEALRLAMRVAGTLVPTLNQALPL